MATKYQTIDKLAPAWRVVSLWGRPVDFCKASGWPYHRVYRWLQSGIIPPQYQAQVLALAKRDRKKLDPSMFIPEAV